MLFNGDTCKVPEVREIWSGGEHQLPNVAKDNLEVV